MQDNGNNASDLHCSPDIWSVVEFLEEFCEIEVVPTSWLEFKEDHIVCKWPPKNCRKYIRNNVQPNSSWDTYTVKVLIQSDSYEKALNYTKKKSNTDTETSCFELGKGKRKRKRKNQDIYCDSSDSLRMTPPPSITTQHDILDLSMEELNNNYITNGKDIATNKAESANFNTNNGTSTKIIDKTDKEENTVAALTNRDKNLTVSDIIIEDVRTESNNIAAVMTNGDRNSMMSNIIVDDLRTDHHVILQILQNVLATRKMIEQQNEFLKQLDSRMNINVASNAAAAINPNIIENVTNIIPTKPFNKYRKLLKFDNGLGGNIAASKQLEMFFYLLGGNTAQVQSKNGLEKLFTNKLGSKCSWFGRKGNYQLCTLNTMAILRNAIRKHFPAYTDKNFQEHVSSWFKYAKTRSLREKAGRDEKENTL